MGESFGVGLVGGVEDGLAGPLDHGAVAGVAVGGRDEPDAGVKPVLRGSAPEDGHGFVRLGRSGA